MTLLQVNNVQCHYPTPAGIVKALDRISLSVAAGETLALVGESGCGKSTLAKVILGLAPVSQGEVLFEGINTKTMTRIEGKHFRRRVQAVFQDPYSSLNPRLRIRTILAEPMAAHGFRRKEQNKRIDQVLEMVGLNSNVSQLFPHEFSGGQRQRIAIARALTLEPSLIVLDEPISALDVSIRAQILNLLQDIQDELGLAYLLIAHDLALVEHVSDRVAVMYLGRIVESGPTNTVFTVPRHPYTEALLSAVPLPDPSAIRNSSLIKGEVASALTPPSGCHFHPRCSYASELCANTVPPMVKSEEVRFACIDPLNN